MKEKIKKYCTSISKICVIEQFTFEEQLIFCYVEIKLINDGFKILKQKKIEQLDELLKLNPHKLPVILNVNGSEVLTKINPSNLDAFDKNQFHITHLEIDSSSYYSVVRQQTIDEVILFLSNHKFLLLDIVIGPYTMGKYLGLFSENENLIPHEFKKEEGILFYSFSQEEGLSPRAIRLGKDETKTHFLSAITVGLEYLINTQFKEAPPSYAVQRVDAIYAKHIRPALFFFLGGMILILMLNFFFEKYLSRTYHDLEIKAGILNKKTNQINDLKTEIAEKERIFESYQLSSGKEFSEYLDVLALLRPAELEFLTLFINPLKKEIKNGEATDLIINTIELSGIVSDLETLNSFIMKLEENNLFRHATIIEFIQETNQAKFKLMVAL